MSETQSTVSIKLPIVKIIINPVPKDVPETVVSKFWRDVVLHPTCVVCQKMVRYKQEQWSLVPKELEGHKCPELTKN